MRLLWIPAFFILACTHPTASSPILAVINSQKITLEAFEKFLEMERWKFGEKAAFSEGEKRQTKEKVLDTFLKNQLLLEEAKRRGIKVSPAEVAESLREFKSHYPKEEDLNGLLTARGWTLKDFEKREADELTIKKLAETITAEAASFSEEALRSYYQDHLAEFEHPEQILARQIVTDSREKGVALREMLLQGASFEETALKYSLSPDRKKGGNLGWFERGILPKEFDDVCFFLPVGSLSSVIKTPYGYHLFQVLDRRPAGRFPFEEVKDKIQEEWKVKKGREVFQAWFEKLRSEAEIITYANILQKIQ